MTRFSVVAFAIALGSLAACGRPTGPPASGANSSAPNAVEQANHGSAGGGASALSPAQGGATTPPPLPK